VGGTTETAGEVVREGVVTKVVVSVREGITKRLTIYTPEKIMIIISPAIRRSRRVSPRCDEEGDNLKNTL
jgi:hypothetical protein